MNKKSKAKNKKSVVGDRAKPSGAEDGSSGEFATEGMGLGQQPAAAAGASGEEITSAEATGPPARSVLDDVAPQPAVVDPSSDGGPTGGECATAGLTLEQQGAATQDSGSQGCEAPGGSGAAGRGRRAAHEWAGAPGCCCARRRCSRAHRIGGRARGVRRGIRAPCRGGAVRAVRAGLLGQGEVVREGGAGLAGGRYQTRSDEWGAMNRTVRLFKAVWQGQELSREAVVKVLGQVLEASWCGAGRSGGVRRDV